MLNVLTEKEVEATVSRPVASDTEFKRMRDWLEGRIAKGKSEPHSEVVLLTPVLAFLLMERNEGNRNISSHNSEAIKNDILANRWMFNGESIVVSVKGHLLDGQHRCDAVIQTRKPITVNLVFGAKEEARFTIDIGRPKSAANFLHMKGYTDCANLAATISLVIEYQRSGDIPASYARPTKTQVTQTADELKGIQASIDIVQSATRRGLGSRAVLAFCHYVFKKRAGAVAADEFITKLLDGDGLRKGNPIFHCRDRLIGLRGNIQARVRVLVVFRAWNHWRLNETVSKIVTPSQMPKLER
jgi:hypothetical protein